MIKNVLKFIGLTIGLAFCGVILAVVDASSDAATMGKLSTFGMVLFFLSPALALFVIWLPIRRLGKQRDKRLESEAAEATEKDFLRRRFLERNRLIDAVDTHRAALNRNLIRAVKKNDYGRIEKDETDEAVYEFFASIDLDETVLDVEHAKQIVFEQLEFRRMEDAESGFDPLDLPFDGHAFEEWVSEALVGFGWTAEVTKGSGDQGIDVIAKKDGKSIGIQCKLYSQAVGNKAIQEAHSGKVYYGLDAVAVITNAGYTSSAKDLGAATGVALLSHHDIPNLFTALFQ
ncbi:restriction endonuclease [Celeribacter marinus]|uniref:restriction endonuclease n=1 Tax=Celeribacter marinus TaxID=1397108 RepID=UPI003F6A63A2